MTQGHRRYVATALGIALAFGAPLADAVKVPKQSVSAVVGGHKVKIKKKAIGSSRLGQGFSIQAGQQPHRLGQLARTLVITCAGGLDSAVFPVAGQFCSVGYSEVRLSKTGLGIKAWAGTADAVHVTLESLEGTRLTGTFDGVLPPGLGTVADPVTLQDGKFSIVLTN